MPRKVSPMYSSEKRVLVGNSWLVVDRTVEGVDFNALWNEKPKTRLELAVPTTEYKGIRPTYRMISCERYSRAFFKPCLFSNEPEQQLPRDLERIMNKWKERDGSINQALVHWFEGDGSIARHSVAEVADNSSIHILYLGAVPRKLTIEPRADSGTGGNVHHITLTNKTVVTMGGTCQQTHTHRVARLKRSQAKDKRCIFVYLRTSTY